MGGYYSGRHASNKPSLEDLCSLDVCQLYRDGVLDTGTKIVIRYPDGYIMKIMCRHNYWGWNNCLEIKYPVWNNNQLETKNQVIGFEWVNVLNGKARRPYFFCPVLEVRAGKLYLGDRGFVHRKCHDCLYRMQRMGAF